MSLKKHRYDTKVTQLFCQNTVKPKIFKEDFFCEFHGQIKFLEYLSLENSYFFSSMHSVLCTICKCKTEKIKSVKLVFRTGIHENIILSEI